MRIGTGIAISNPMSFAGGAGPVSAPMIFTVETVSADEVFAITFETAVDAVVDWGDGTQSVISDISSYDRFHLYEVAGNYTVQITGFVSSFRFAVYGSKVRTVQQLGNLGLTSLANAFSNCVNMTSFNAAPCSTTGVTSFRSFFNTCLKLQSVNLSGIDTSSATDMAYFFAGCRQLTSVDLSPLDFSSATTAEYFFNDSVRLTSVDLSGKSFPQCTTFRSMFDGCKSLASANLSGISCPAVSVTWDMFRLCRAMSALDMTGVSMPSLTNAESMFEYCSSITSVSAGFVTGSAVTNFKDMFRHCLSMTSVNVSGVDTSSVTDFSGMFFGCTSLASIDVSGFAVSAATNISDMFASCKLLSNLPIAGWNVSNVTSAAGFASGVTFSTANYDAILLAWSALTLKSNVAIDFGRSIYTAGSASDTARLDMNRLYGWRFADLGSTLSYGGDFVFSLVTTASPESFTMPFTAVTNATIDWGDGTTSVVTSTSDPDRIKSYASAGAYVVRISGDFTGIGALPTSVTEIRQFGTSGITAFGGFNSSTSGKCFAFHAKNCNCPGLTFSTSHFGATSNQNLICIELDGYNPSVSSMANAFSSRTALQAIYLGGFASVASSATSFASSFASLFNCRTIDLNGVSTASATSVNSMFSGSSRFCEVDTSGFSSASLAGDGFSNIFRGCSNAQSADVSWMTNANMTSFASIFDSCSSLVSVDVSSFQTIASTNFSRMFYSCTLVDEIDASNLDLSSATNLSNMFDTNTHLKSIILPDLSVTGSVTNFAAMFKDLRSITSLDVSALDTSSATSMSQMFMNVYSVSDLDVSGFSTGLVTNMSAMFFACGLANPDVSAFNTSSCTNTSQMFLNCVSAIPNISGFNTAIVTNMNSMFSGCPGICDADLAALEINSVTGTGLTNFAASVLINTSKYDALLIGWDAQSPKNNSLTPNFGFSRYTPGGAAEAARANLISTNLWTITDGGAVT